MHYQRSSSFFYKIVNQVQSVNIQFDPIISCWGYKPLIFFLNGGGGGYFLLAFRSAFLQQLSLFETLYYIPTLTVILCTF